MKEHPEKPTNLNADTRVPIYIVSSAVALAIYITIWMVNLKHAVENSVSYDALNSWIMELDHQNRTLVVPVPPHRPQSAAAPAPPADANLTDRRVQVVSQ